MDNIAKNNYQLFCGKKFDENNVLPIVNLDGNKPFGGLWISGCKNSIEEIKEIAKIELKKNEISNSELDYFIKSNPIFCGGNGWIDFASEFRSINSCTIIKIKDNANILEINSYLDIQKYRLKDVFPNSKYDFEKMVKDGIDGLHLTQNAEGETHDFAHGVNPLYGWDGESTLILSSPNKKITDVIEIISTFEPFKKWNRNYVHD